VTITERFIKGYVNHYIVINMHKKDVAKKISEKDEKLLEEIKRIKKLQKGLYKEYEIEEIEDDD
jgi:hypothetical protein